MKKLTLILSTVLLMSSTAAFSANKRELRHRIQLLELQLNQCSGDLAIYKRGGGRRNKKAGYVCTMKMTAGGNTSVYKGEWEKYEEDARLSAVNDCKGKQFPIICDQVNRQKFNCVKTRK